MKTQFNFIMLFSFLKTLFFRPHRRRYWSRGMLYVFFPSLSSPFNCLNYFISLNFWGGGGGGGGCSVWLLSMELVPLSSTRSMCECSWWI
jgi:hypothetical protein